MMRKWLFILVILAVFYVLSRINQTKQVKSPFLKRLNKSVTIITWVLLAFYSLVFLYWLYTQFFK